MKGSETLSNQRGKCGAVGEYLRLQCLKIYLQTPSTSASGYSRDVGTWSA